MQGRLSPMVGEKIQAFPWDTWNLEFSLAQRLGLTLIEWTLDQDRLYQNPLLTREGQKEIRRLCLLHKISIPSLTGDCFMQSPLWKAVGRSRNALEADFFAIARACGVVGINTIVVPLVDGGRLENKVQEDVLVALMNSNVEFFRELGLRIIFESDFVPSEVARFIDRFPEDVFGINYDIGNSAALGYKPVEEFAAYGERIMNVHVKDRTLGGTTVPLGMGNADFTRVFSLLRNSCYTGHLIMQTARAEDGKHAAALERYKSMIEGWIRDS